MNLVKLQDTKLKDRNLLHFYTLTIKNLKKEFQKTITFIIASKRIKYLGINLPRRQKTCMQKIMILMKEIQHDKQMDRYGTFFDWKIGIVCTSSKTDTSRE